MAVHVNTCPSSITHHRFMNATADSPPFIPLPRTGASSLQHSPSKYVNACSFMPSRRQSELPSTPFARRKNSTRVAASVFAATAPGQAGGGVTEYEDGDALEKYIQEEADKLIVLDVSTKTCGPCKFIYPKLLKLSIDYPDAIFLKINGDNNSSTRALMKKWGIRAVPNFRFYRNGKLIHSHTGANEDELRAYFLTHYKTVSV